LSSIPEFIGNLTNLTHLSLTNNGLSSIPEFIGNLTNLTHLSLAHNALQTLPETIGNLTNLTHLYLDNNHDLQIIPASINDLINLKELSVRGVKSIKIPIELKDKNILLFDKGTLIFYEVDTHMSSIRNISRAFRNGKNTYTFKNGRTIPLVPTAIMGYTISRQNSLPSFMLDYKKGGNKKTKKYRKNKQIFKKHKKTFKRKYYV
jgi:hypothetical protein